MAKTSDWPPERKVIPGSSAGTFLIKQSKVLWATSSIPACSIKSFPEVKIINLGSSCIYPLNTINPIKESSVMDGKLETTNSPYAMAKLTAIEIGDAMTKQFGHEVINLMPTNLYGPNDNFNPTSSHVIPGMIYKFHQAKYNKENNILTSYYT